MLTGVGILGASAAYSPVFSIGLFGAATSIATYKLVMSDSAKKGLILLLKGVNQAVQTSTNPAMIRRLRADRAIIADELKNAEITKDPEQETSKSQKNSMSR